MRRSVEEIRRGFRSGVDKKVREKLGAIRDSVRDRLGSMGLPATSGVVMAEVDRAESLYCEAIDHAVKTVIGGAELTREELSGIADRVIAFIEEQIKPYPPTEISIGCVLRMVDRELSTREMLERHKQAVDRFTGVTTRR